MRKVFGGQIYLLQALRLSGRPKRDVLPESASVAYDDDKSARRTFIEKTVLISGLPVLALLADSYMP